MSKKFSQTAAFIWSVADLLRGDFKRNTSVLSYWAASDAEVS